MSGSPRVEVPSACERGPGTPLTWASPHLPLRWSWHLRSHGPPGRGGHTSPHLPAPASTSAPDPGAPAARMQQALLDAHLCAHDHACSRAARHRHCLLGREPGAGDSQPDLPMGTRRRDPKGHGGYSVHERFLCVSVSLFHPDRGRLEKRGCVSATTFGPELTVSDCNVTMTVVNRLLFLTLSLTVSSLFCRFFLRNRYSGLGLACQRRACFPPATGAGSPGPTQSPQPGEWPRFQIVLSPSVTIKTIFGANSYNESKAIRMLEDKVLQLIRLPSSVKIPKMIIKIMQLK